MTASGNTASLLIGIINVVLSPKSTPVATLWTTANT